MSQTTQDIHKTIAEHPNIDWNIYRGLIYSQIKLGWEQLKFGGFTHEWNKQQEQYEQHFPNASNKENTG
eukprot:3736338-Ditylum_brightwellii.AAC.1